VNTFPAEGLVQMEERARGVRLSLFLPLSPGSPRSTKTRIRAKTLLAHTERALRSSGLPRVEVERMLGGVRDAIDAARPQRYNDLGLAVLADGEAVRAYRFPSRLPELAVIGDRFFVTPLLPMITRRGDFYLLALSQHEICLYEGTPSGLEPVNVDGLDLAAWTSLPPRREPQVHAFLADRGGDGSRAVYHGVEEADERKARVLRHFRGADRALMKLIGGGKAPLVLAGVRHLQALYRTVNSYPHLLEQGVDGSPDGLTAEALHRQAWSIVEPGVRDGHRPAVERYQRLRGTGWTAGTAEEAHAAATAGQVDTLLVNEEACLPPAARDGDPVIRLHPGSATQQLEDAAVAVLARGGVVVAVRAADMPEPADMVAILRYWSPPDAAGRGPRVDAEPADRDCTEVVRIASHVERPHDP
jgi:hypothetical protein